MQVRKYNDVPFPITHCNECDSEMEYDKNYTSRYQICPDCIKRLQYKDLLKKQHYLWKKYLKNKSKDAIMYATAIEQTLLS